MGYFMYYIIFIWVGREWVGLNVRNAAAEAIGMGRRVNKYFREGQKQKLLTQNGTPWCVCGMRENGPHSLSVVWHCPVCVRPALDPSQRIPYLTPIVHSGWLACWIEPSFPLSAGAATRVWSICFWCSCPSLHILAAEINAHCACNQSSDRWPHTHIWCTLIGWL